MSLERVVQFHLEVTFFDGFLHGEQQFSDESRRLLEKQEVCPVLEGLDGSARITLVRLEQDRCIGSIAAQAGDQVHAALRGQFLINQDNVPVSLLAEGQCVIRRVAGFDATTGEKRAQAGGHQLDFFGVFVDEEDVERRFRQGHGRSHARHAEVRSRCPVPALQELGPALPYSDEHALPVKGTLETAEGRSMCMDGSISYTFLRIPVRCQRGRFYFRRGDRRSESTEPAIGGFDRSGPTERPCPWNERSEWEENVCGLGHRRAACAVARCA